DPPTPVLSHPERPFRPREPGVATAARRRDGREHATSLRIDPLDAVLGDLEQVLAIEGGSRVCGDVDRAHRLAGLRIEGVQLVAGRNPDGAAVECAAGPRVGAREGTILAENLGC